MQTETSHQEVSKPLVATLVFVFKDDCSQVLLGLKKRGFGKGFWNGFGGKLQAGETIVQAAVRELAEESGIKKKETDLQKRGIIMFEFKSAEKPSWFFEVHIYSTTYNDEEIVESEEMKPEWFSVSKIPFESMWEDDRFWLPCVLRGGYIMGFYPYDDITKNMLSGITEIVLPNDPRLSELDLDVSGQSSTASPSDSKKCPKCRVNTFVVPDRFPMDFRQWIATGGFFQHL
ncbi:putative 7,8-dihydro-8-oxoguanine triphosphatase-like protein [Monocercomonoides exilis]|uniref:putative 7,8-dihydro-8-oxoguanine triphosphatase-like protein n=1 Tax=Monocercomonoides exilis TaxID=2049356 RepID=UPI00355A44C1|nr:putative 7,8-dihydro-8-oxoguanine triphosphatase-like protein [Monocercomonoides exilis]|eukprot:MONOS_5465.1-p1 / transcript=MONOS_5465.1 / gene=MONOS_5465 / organism=Monocercomonoides_exilis_PA203 / gene_product=DNA mistmatch repair protein MutT / transcript_product=DNA mistmatch repair protein MutT / location=Mono_scaffold00159:38893-39654(-) / protein_length=230 / sequence_SO=supercontig / SO=protein_coding / is_pseudo=false